MVRSLATVLVCIGLISLSVARADENKTNAAWAQLARDDRTSIVFDGHRPNRLACDTTLRKMPDGSWVMVMLGGGDTEPLPANRVFITRSLDRGESWSSMEPIDFGIKAADPKLRSPTQDRRRRCTLWAATALPCCTTPIPAIAARLLCGSVSTG